jgi:hypothetical protein
LELSDKYDAKTIETILAIHNTLKNSPLDLDKVYSLHVGHGVSPHSDFREMRGYLDHLRKAWLEVEPNIGVLFALPCEYGPQIYNGNFLLYQSHTCTSKDFDDLEDQYAQMENKGDIVFKVARDWNAKAITESIQKEFGGFICKDYSISWNTKDKFIQLVFVSNDAVILEVEFKGDRWIDKTFLKLEDLYAKLKLELEG